MATIVNSSGVKIEDAIGVVDGVNKIFSAPEPFVPGSIVSILNGVAEPVQSELTTTSVRLLRAPVEGEVVRLQYERATA